MIGVCKLDQASCVQDDALQQRVFIDLWTGLTGCTKASEAPDRTCHLLHLVENVVRILTQFSVTRLFASH